MVHTKISLQFLILALSTAVFVGCPNPDKVADDFSAEREGLPYEALGQDMAVGPEVAGCPGIHDASGTYILAVVTNLDPGKALLMKSDVTIDVEAEPPTLKMILTPLSVADRSPVGAAIETAVVPIDEEGRFELPFGNVVVTGVANPISGSEIEADLTMQGQIQSSTRICGGLTGRLIRPADFDLAGSTVGLVQITDGDFQGATPVGACLPCDAPDQPDAGTGEPDVGVTDAGTGGSGAAGGTGGGPGTGGGGAS